MEPEVAPVEKKETVAEKCGDGVAPMVWAGGARTFGDYDTFLDAVTAESQVQEQQYIFNNLVQNILNAEDLSLSSKLALVGQAVRDMEPRLTETEKSVGIFEKVKDLVAGVLGVRAREDLSNVLEKPLGAFVVTKDVNGNRRWVALVSNKFQDRDGEIFEEKAHEEFVDWVTRTKQYPELWVWHTPGSRIGVADFVAYMDGFLVETGVFDKGMEDVADRLAAKDDRGVSHGFMYRPEDKAKRVYTWYRSFETSVLPHKRAANNWTAFADIKEGAMTLSAEQRSDMVDILGETRVKNLEIGLPALKDKLEEEGVSWKAVQAMVGEDGGGNGGADDGAPDPNGGEGTPDKGEGAPEKGGTPNQPTPGDGSPDPGTEKPAGGAGGDGGAGGAGAGGGDGGQGGDGEQGVLATAISQFQALLAPIAAGISTLGTRLDTIEGTVKSLQDTDEAKIARALAPKRPDPSNEGDRPSQSKETVLSPGLAAAIAKIAGESDDKEVADLPTDRYYKMAVGDNGS